MALKTRKPTGTPAWDLMLIAAGWKCGKSFKCAEASASDVIGRTFWFNFGEADPDEYGALVTEDGRQARFEIVDYRHTYAGLMHALAEAIAEPRTDGKPNLIVLDKASKVWDVLSDQADYAARSRAAKKNKLDHVPPPEQVGDEVTIGSDLWNSATNRWLDMIDLLKTHDGPVILTANLKEVTVMDAAGRPTKQKQWKIEGQKNFAADVSCVVEIPALREVYVTGVRSLRFEPVKTGVHTADTRFADFTVEKLWAVLGLTSESTKRDHAVIERPGTDPDGIVADEIRTAIDAAMGQPTPQERDAALTEVWQTYGDATLNSTSIVAPNGSPMRAMDALRECARIVKQQIEAAQAPPPARAPQEAAHAQPAHETRAPEAEQHPAQRAANAQQAADSARQSEPANAVLGMLRDEIVGHAQALGLTAASYSRPIVDTVQGATSVDNVPLAKLTRWVIEQRPHVVAALREQGAATAAAALEKAPPAPAKWATLTGPRESVFDGAHETTPEGAQG